MDKKCIIIGAGPAGLTAAWTLLQQTDFKPLILEETDMVGGISRTINYKGNRMDIGGHRFFSKNDDVMKFWTDLLPIQGSPAWDDKLLNANKTYNENGPDPEICDDVMLIRRRVSRILYLRRFFDYPISMKLETFLNLGMIRTVKAGIGYVGSIFFKRNEKSLKDFMINRFGNPLYKMFFEDYTEKVWGRNPSEISAEWGAQRIKGLSLMKAVLNVLKKPFTVKSIHQKSTETSLIEQFMYPKKGPGHLWETLMDKIKNAGGEIIMNCQINGVERDAENRITAVSGNCHGAPVRFSGDQFISTIPVKDLIAAMDEIPEKVQSVARELPYRDFITVGLLVKSLKIKNKTAMKTVHEIVPDCWIYIQEWDVKIGRLQIFNNWSPYMVADPEHTVWIGLEYFCNEDDELWSMDDQSFIKFASKELCHIGIVDSDAVLDGICVRVKKAYPAYFDSYSDFPVVQSFLDSIPNLFCVGRNGQHRYNNMDHSMLTAFEAVRLIKENSVEKQSVWAVNTEEEYHEKRKEVSVN